MSTARRTQAAPVVLTEALPTLVVARSPKKQSFEGKLSDEIGQLTWRIKAIMQELATKKLVVQTTVLDSFFLSYILNSHLSNLYSSGFPPRTAVQAGGVVLVAVGEINLVSSRDAVCWIHLYCCCAVIIETSDEQEFIS